MVRRTSRRVLTASQSLRSKVIYELPLKPVPNAPPIQEELYQLNSRVRETRRRDRQTCLLCPKPSFPNLLLSIRHFVIEQSEKIYAPQAVEHDSSSVLYSVNVGIATMKDSSFVPRRICLNKWRREALNASKAVSSMSRAG